jgi:hypothetical protein
MHSASHASPEGRAGWSQRRWASAGTGKARGLLASQAYRQRPSHGLHGSPAPPPDQSGAEQAATHAPASTECAQSVHWVGPAPLQPPEQRGARLGGVGLAVEDDALAQLVDAHAAGAERRVAHERVAARDGHVVQVGEVGGAGASGRAARPPSSKAGLCDPGRDRAGTPARRLLGAHGAPLDAHSCALVAVPRRQLHAGRPRAAPAHMPRDAWVATRPARQILIGRRRSG